jgi:predicted PurR-regulated permease PerM
MGEFQATVEYLRDSLIKYRRTVFWVLSAAFLLVLLAAVKEVTTLVLAAYGIALLLDPIVSSLEKRRVSRSVSIICIFIILLAAVLALIIIAGPAIVQEYQDLIQFLPGYLRTVGEKIAGFLQAWLGISVAASVDKYTDDAKQYVSALGVDQVKTFALGIGQTVLKGYSIVLTLVNLCLLPFFVYYIARDLRLIHRFLGSFVSAEARDSISVIGDEILTHVYAFFKGQLTVSVILALLYFIGFSIVGLPSALIVGLIAGLLNVVPYLGMTIGLILATVITAVSQPTLWQFGLVYLVFIIVQGLEGNVLTPRIVGKSVGLHPLGVMLLLIIGGKLFGLLGLVLAIPAAATIRVLFRHLHAAIEQEG